MFCQLDEELEEEALVEVLAHLVEDKPITDGALPDEIFHKFTIRAGVKVKTQLEKKKKKSETAAEESDPLEKSQESHCSEEEVPPPQEKVDLVIINEILSFALYQHSL